MPAWMPGALAARSVGQLQRRGDADAGHSSCTPALEECPRQRPVDAENDEAAGRALIPLVSLPAMMRARGQVRSRSRGGASCTLLQRPATGGLTPAMGVGLLLLLAMVPRPTAGFTQTAWRPTNGPLSGTEVTILGTNFGLGASEVRARIGGTACTNTRWTSDSSIGATVSPATFRSANNVVLTLATMNIRTSQGLFTFDAAVIRFASSSNAPAASDGRTLTIAGQNFGTYDTSPRARVGDTTCEATKWISGSIVHCKVPSGSALPCPVAPPGCSCVNCFDCMDARLLEITVLRSAVLCVGRTHTDTIFCALPSSNCTCFSVLPAFLRYRKRSRTGRKCRRDSSPR